MVVKKAKTFNIDDYKVKTEAAEVTLNLDGGVVLSLMVKELPWKRRNIHIIACTSVVDGVASFDADKYTSLCLKEMIVEAPWGVTDDAFLSSINGILGDALTTLAPVPLSAEDYKVNVADQVKK